MGIAYMICLGNTGGIIGSYIFREEESPRYPTGFGASLGFATAGVGACIVLELIYKTINAKREAMTEQEIRNKYTEEELNELGDQSPLFRYTL
jgi:uncharacterized membrane protein YeaQ/YmgE (transglycosylase-associated protein family)